ncbi:MAG TPA: hypothetical protein EYG46_20830 [Myxococcales bacterium]|nr:hypothetical protein [Myxococcales bacterium]
MQQKLQSGPTGARAANTTEHNGTPQIVIGKRFQGPPESGNGGYVCGRLAQSIDGGAAVVRLRVAPLHPSVTSP